MYYFGTGLLYGHAVASLIMWVGGREGGEGRVEGRDPINSSLAGLKEADR